MAVSLHFHFGLDQACTYEIIFLAISTHLLWLTRKSDTGEQIGCLFSDTKMEYVNLACVWYNPTTNNHSTIRSGLGLA